MHLHERYKHQEYRPDDGDAGKDVIIATSSKEMKWLIATSGSWIRKYGTSA